MGSMVFGIVVSLGVIAFARTFFLQQEINELRKRLEEG